MTKEIKYNSLIMKLTKSKSDTYYRVELQDKYGMQVIVYEKTFQSVCQYADKWEKATEKRKIKHELETKAIEEMIAIDRARGTMLSLD